MTMFSSGKVDRCNASTMAETPVDEEVKVAFAELRMLAANGGPATPIWPKILARLLDALV
jgi:hypothetical protein